jgi:hypothetical protein
MDFTDIKNRYENEFLPTERGQQLARDANEMMGDDGASGEDEPYTFTTKGVRREYLPDVLHKAELVKIVPIGLNNMCYQNATWLEQEFGLKKVYGFNIVACRCGGRMTFELHAVNITPDGKLIDITRDYCGETEKWFVPFENDNFNEELNRLIFEKKFIVFEPKCRCRGKNERWNNSRFILADTETEFERYWKVFHTKIQLTSTSTTDDGDDWQMINPQ